MSSEAKRHAEVSLNRLTAYEKGQFDQAKKKELDQWVSHAVFSIAKRSGVPRERIMTMRWVLTWKIPDGTADQSKRIAKARLVVKGFTDPDLTTIRAESPTLSRLGKHMLFQVSASNNWPLVKGDVKTAFLQGDRAEAQRDVYVEPTAEIQKILGLNRDDIMKLEGAVYGLRNAPRAWFERIKRDLLKLGTRQHQLDSCLFLIFEGTRLVGLVGVYVDDCLMCGDSTSKAWKTFIDKFKNTYTWSPWETRDFMFTGTHIRQSEDGTIKLTQEDFAKGLRQVEVPHSSPEQNLTPQQLTALRGADGSLQWLVSNTRLDLAAPTSICQGNHGANAQVKHALDTNKVVRTAHTQSNVPVYFHPIELSKLSMVTYHDAGQGSRPDGSSQGGYLIAVAHNSILDGKECKVSLLDWKSFRLKRVARSSLSAEVQAFAEALDALEFAKLFLAEVLDPYGIDLRYGADKAIAEICPSPLITDCKSLFDAVERSQSTGLNLSERRSSIEVMACRERMKLLDIHMRWVNSDRQLADGLTKSAAAWKLLAFQMRPVTKLIFDPEFTAAKKLKAKDTMTKGDFKKVIGKIKMNLIKNQEFKASPTPPNTSSQVKNRVLNRKNYIREANKGMKGKAQVRVNP